MDPFSVSSSAIALVAAGTTAVTSAKGFYEDYREADKQALHAQRLRLLVQTNQAQLKELSSQLKEAVKPAHASITDIEAAFPTNINSRRKRDRFFWATHRKGKVNVEISRLMETESSTTLTLVLALFKEIEAIKADISAIRTNTCNIHNETIRYRTFIENCQQKLEADLHKFGSLFNLTASNVGLYRKAAQIHRCTWLHTYLGISASLIVSRDKRHDTYRLFFRWPLSWARVLTGRVSILGARPSFPILSMRQQNIIPRESAIIEACNNNAVATIQQLFATGQAHPNDTTPDNLTLLRFAIRTGNPAVVNVLLEHGADANLTFGARETSPLNNAFLLGKADIVRSLLSAGADLEYVNSRAWTSLSYLWDPDLPHHSETSELLDICGSHSFSSWNHADTLGWSPIHRASAFGFGSDVRKLLNMGAYIDAYTVDARWGPVQCAVRWGNHSTFDALAELMPPAAFLRMRDSRGWTLLHLAAERGDEDMIVKLLRLGADTELQTDAASVLVPEGLEFKELTPRTVAVGCGHGQTYENALAVAGCVSENADVRALREDELAELP